MTFTELSSEILIRDIKKHAVGSIDALWESFSVLKRRPFHSILKHTTDIFF